VNSCTPRLVRLCRDPRNADRAKEKNFIPWMRKVHRNSACMYYLYTVWLFQSVFIDKYICSTTQLNPYLFRNVYPNDYTISLSFNKYQYRKRSSHFIEMMLR